ncbi:MAG: hypothetical protein WCA36_06990 [Pseudolabrys sp.]
MAMPQSGQWRMAGTDRRDSILPLKGGRHRPALIQVKPALIQVKMMRPIQPTVLERDLIYLNVATVGLLQPI